MRGWAPLRAAVAIVASIAVVLGVAPAASAAYAVQPVGPSWVPNGGVHAVAVDPAANLVYVGGTFTGGVAALRADTGALVWNGNANGDVRALALAPNGRLLLGGAFTTVGGFTHRKLAVVNASTGTIDNTIKPAVGGTVRDIVVIGNIAYYGGGWSQHNGITQANLGAFDLGTGRAVSAFTASTNGVVYALGTDNTRLFIGGNYTAVNGQVRNQLASVTLSSTYPLDAWAPARACTGCNVVWDLTVDIPRNRVYTVGRNAGTLYTLNKTTGAELFRVRGGVNGDSQAVTLAPDGRVYVGGHFVTVSGQTRMLVAEFDVSGSSAVLGPFSTRFVTTFPGVWAMASTSSRLYVGGDFTQAGAQNRYPYFAMFPSTGADTAAPTVTSTTPANGAATVAVSTNVTATFNEPMQGVSDTTFTLTPAGGSPVDATVSAGAGNQYLLNPTADLAAGTTYTATLTGGTTAIRDTAGNPLTTVNWTFSTTPPPDTASPTVTSTDPADGATAVALTANVTATFSEPVPGVSDTNFTLTPTGGTAVSATVTQTTGNRWVLDPEDALLPDTEYTARLASTGITDTANNPFAGHSWTFRTAAAPTDTTPPIWTGRIPSRDGATGISRTTNVTVAFNEEVTNVGTTTFTLTPANGGAVVQAVVSFNATSGRWVLNPISSLAANTTYRAVVTNGVTDLAGNPFAGMTWRFTTGA